MARAYNKKLMEKIQMANKNIKICNFIKKLKKYKLNKIGFSLPYHIGKSFKDC